MYKKETKESVDNAERRDFFKEIGLGGVKAVAGAAALFTGSNEAEAAVSWARWFQKNFRLMTEEEKDKAISYLEKKYSEKFEKQVNVDKSPAMEDVLFGYALNIQTCIGCRRCVKACAEENNQSRHDPEIEWIRVLQMEKGNFSIENKGEAVSGNTLNVGEYAHKNAGVTLEGEHYYEPEKVPEKDFFYFPVQCMQCENPPCVKVCPIQATWREPDGIVVIDYDWCFGCRMCMSACPYGARHFNWGKPNLPKENVNPDTHYLGNRPRTNGVMEKCTFCIQRVREGRYPACLEACPVGARKFGNLLDTESEIRKILENKRVFRSKVELNTYPKFFYYID